MRKQSKLCAEGKSKSVRDCHFDVKKALTRSGSNCSRSFTFSNNLLEEKLANQSNIVTDNLPQTTFEFAFYFIDV